MRGWEMTTATLALALASCGPKPLSLPEEPIARAATCGVVEAAGARKAAGVKALPLAAQGRILHYALLTGARGAVFDTDKAQAVVKRMPEIQETVIAGKWQDLAPACAAAFPETRQPAGLPRDTADAQLSCYMLDDFLKTALAAQDASYADAIGKWSALSTKLDAKVGARLGGLSSDALQQRRREALATAAKLGPPVEVMEQCLAKYG